MSGKATGKVTEDEVWVPQKDGAWYCFYRRRVLEDGKVKVSSRKLLGKATERGGEISQTRPRRKWHAAGPEPQGRAVEATRPHTPGSPTY